MVFGSALASTAAMAWWRCGIEALARPWGRSRRMLDFSSAALSCLRVSSTPLTSLALQRRLQAVHHRQQALGEALDGVFLAGCRLGLGALAGIVGVGDCAHHRVALLLDLRLGFGQQLLERFLGLNGFFLHLVEVGIGRYFSSITTY